MTDQQPSTKKTTPPSEWFKNVAKSVGYSTSDIIKDITPGIHTLIGDNVSYGKELLNDAKESMAESKSMVTMFSMDNQFKIGRDAINNAIEDIKSGKIYNKERMESYEDDDFSEFMSGMEDGTLGDTSSSDSESTKQPTIINNTKIVKENNSKLISAVETTATANLKSAEAMMAHNTNLHASKATMDHKVAMTTLKGLESINENIGQLVNFQNDSMSKYVAASIQYYDESLGVMKNSLDKLIAMSPKQKEEGKQRTSQYEEVFGGGSFSLEGYIKNVKANFDRMKDTNMIVNFVSSIFEDTDTLSYLAKSPLQFLSNAITKHIVPMTIRSTMEQLDKSMTEFFPAMLNKLSRMSNSGNPIFELIGGMFGIDVSTKSSADMSKYMRGAIPFDGETKRAITDIIPTYLRKIYSFISGKKEIAFDWEKGSWNEVDAMKAGYEKAKLDKAKEAYSNQYNVFSEFMNNIRFENEKDRENFQSGIEKFLYNIARSDENIKFDGSRESKEAVNRLHDFGSDRQMQDLFYGMLSNLDRSDQVNLVGAGRYKALDNIDKFFRNIEDNPTVQNAMTILSGLDPDSDFEKNADGVITKRNSSSLIASGINSRVDKYGKDDLFYLRNINDVLLEGIKVYPYQIAGIHGNNSERMKERLDGFRSHKETKIEEQSTKSNNTLSGDSLKSFDANLGIDLTGSRNYNYEDKFKQIKEAKAQSEKSYKDSFGDTIGSMMDDNQEKFNRVKSKLDEIVRKPADVLEAAFDKIDETLYNIVFGIKDDGRGSFMDLTLDKMQGMFANVGEFAIDKIFLPIGEFLGTTGKKVANTVDENPLIQAVKDGVKFWFVGEKGENGKHEGGIFSEILNSTKDVAKAFNYSITGVAYTDSNGVRYEKNDDSFFGSVKNLVKDIYSSTKIHFFGDKNSPDKDKQRGVLTIVTDSLGDGMADWSNTLFGTERDKNKSGTQILKENTTTFVKNVPRGFLGMVGGSLAGSALTAGLGLVGSMFLPGAPVALAMLGGALGMATGFDSFNDWAFGEIGGNGKRIGGALLSYNQKEFLKNNKNTLIGGAIGGMVLSGLGNTVIDGLIPGAGAILDFLSPFGPIGAAMQGMATAMIMKSTAVMDWLFGPKGMDGARMGGMIQRLFKKPNMEISKKAVGNKLGFAAIGALGGSLLGGSAATAISSFGLIPALLATPIGPVTGAIAGLGAAIALSSGTVRKFLFGSYDEEKDKTTLGVLGKSFNMMKIEFLEPMMRTFSTTIQHTANWFSNNFMAKMQFAVEPIIKTFIDSAKGLVKLTKGVLISLPMTIFKVAGDMIGKVVGTIKDTVGDAINEKIILPIGKLFGTLVATPIRKMNEMLFKGIFSVARGINTLGASLLMVPAAMKMTFDQTLAGSKSLLKGIVGIFKKEEGTTVGSRAKSAFDPRRIYADAISDPSTGYVNRLNAAYSDKMENYRARREEIRAEKRARDEEWKSARNRARKSNYNELSGEGDTVARIISATTRKGTKNRDLIAKLQSDVFSQTGLTINELLGLNPDEDVNQLSKNQLKALQGMIKTSHKTGKVGKELKDHLGITEYQRSQEEAMKNIIQNVSDIAGTLESIDEGIKKMAGIQDSKEPGESAKSIVNIPGSKDSDNDESEEEVSKSTGKKRKKKVRGKKNKEREAEERRKSSDESIGGGIFGDIAKLIKVDDSKEESLGGAVLGNLFNTMKSAASRVFSSVSYTEDDVHEIGCGPIVLAMAMGIHGVKVNPKTIFEYAIKNNLVVDGIGVSSDLFKLFAGRRGFVVEFAKGNVSNLEALFRNNRTIIARINTGAGHFVLLRGYDRSNQTVSVKDPMKQFGGRTDVKTIMRYVTHLYGIRKKNTSSDSLGDVKDIKNKLFGSVKESMSRRPVDSTTSVAGAITGTVNDSEIMKDANSIIIDGVKALPVYIVKSKEEKDLEEDRFNRLMEASGGDSSYEAAASANEKYNPNDVNSKRRGLNRVSETVSILRGLFNIGREGFNRGRESFNNIKGMSREDWGQMFSSVRENTRNRIGGAVTDAKVTAAQGPMAIAGALVSGSGRAVGKIGKITARIARGIAGVSSGAKVMNALVQAGNVSSQANLNSMAPNYNTAASAEPDFNINANASPEEQVKQFNRHKNVNNFLNQKASEATAQALANFQTNQVDLSTRIEINTRYIAQRLDDLYDLNKKFYDWLKNWLENFDPCCGGGGGGSGGSGGNGGNGKDPKDPNNPVDPPPVIPPGPSVPPVPVPKPNDTDNPADVPRTDTPNFPDIIPFPNKPGTPPVEVPNNPKIPPIIPIPTPLPNRRSKPVKPNVPKVPEVIPFPDAPDKPKETPDKKPEKKPVKPVEVPEPSKEPNIPIPEPIPGKPKETPDKKPVKPVDVPEPSKEPNLPIPNPVPEKPNPKEPIPFPTKPEKPKETPGKPVKPSDPIPFPSRPGKPIDVPEQPKTPTVVPFPTRTDDIPLEPVASKDSGKVVTLDPTKKQKTGKKGIPAAIGDILMNEAGSVNVGKIGDGLKDLGGKVASKLPGSGVLKTIGKGIGKTATKLFGGVATGGALAAGMTALDSKNGYDNAATLLKKDPKKVNKFDKIGAGAAAGIVGFIPLIDMADDLLGGHAKEVLGKTVASSKELLDKTSTIWEEAKTNISDGWSSTKDTVKSKVSDVVAGTKEKWDGVKTDVSTKWDETKTAVTEKATEVAKDAKDKWSNFKDGVSTKWDETKTAVTEKATEIAKDAKDKWNGFTSGVSKKWDETKTSITTKASEISKDAKTKWGTIKSGVSKKWSETKTNVTAKATEIAKDAKSKWSSIKTGVTKKWTETKTSVTSKASEIAKDAKSKWTSIKSGVTKKWTETKTNVTAKAKEIASDAKSKWSSIKTDVTKKWTETKTNVTSKAKEIASDAKSKWSAAKTEVSAKWSDFKSNVTSKAGEIKTAIQEKIESGKSGVTSAFSGFASAVSSAASAIASAIKSKIEAAKSFVSSIKAKGEEYVRKLKSKAKKDKGGPDDNDQEIRSLSKEMAEDNKLTKNINIGGPSSKDGEELTRKLSKDTKSDDVVTGKGSAVDKNKNKKILEYPEEFPIGKGLTDELAIGGPSIKDAEKLNALLPGTYAKGNDIYYSQKDSRWANMTLAGDSKFGVSGCGPTAIANVVSSITGEKVLPTEALKFAQESGMVDPEKGTNADLFSTFGSTKGVPVFEDKATPDNIMTQLASGNKVILRGKDGANYTKAGHYIIADGITNDGKIKIKDPISKERSGEFKPEAVMSGLTNAFVATNPNTSYNSVASDVMGAGDMSVNTVENLLAKTASVNGNKVFAKGGTGFMNPAPKAVLKSRFGWRNIDERGLTFHYGVDLAQAGTVEIKAAADGVVTFAGPRGTYGNLVIIRHTIDGKRMDTVYAHLRNGGIKVRANQTVKQGQTIGIMGNTGRSYGQHLHFEIHNGAYNYKVTNINPEPYIFKNGDPTPKWVDKYGLPDGLKGKNLAPSIGSGVNNPVVGGDTSSSSSASSGVMDALTGAAAILAGTTTASSSDPMSKLNSINYMPSAISKLPELLQGMSNAALFGTAIAASTGISSSGSDGTVSAQPAGKVSGDDVASKVWNVLSGKGLSANAIAGILGNLQQESTMDPKKLQNGYTKGYGAGLAQWTIGDRWSVLEKFAKKKNMEPWAAETQAEFIWEELNYKGSPWGSASELNKKSVADAALYFSSKFERPKASAAHNDKRQNYAMTWYDKLSGKMKTADKSKAVAGNGVGGPDDSNIVNGDLKKGNIYDIMKQTEFATKEVELPKVAKASVDSLMGIGGPEDTEFIVKSNRRIDDISYENDKYTDFNIKNEKVYASGDNTKNVVESYNDSWSSDNIDKVIKVLETIATNTADTKNSITTMNSFYTSNNVSTDKSSNVKGSAERMPRQMDQGYVRRNKQILSSRK